MATLRKLDAFVKPREDLRTRSALGGLITVVAASAATILFLSQIYLYIAGVPRHSLHLSESTSVPVPALNQAFLQRRGKIPFNVYVTFPHVQCKDLEITLDGAYLRNGQLEKSQGHGALRMRMPTETELATALGKGVTTSPPNGCTVQGTLHIPQVGGTFSITVSKQAWAEVNAFALFRVNNGEAGHKMHNVRCVMLLVVVSCLPFSSDELRLTLLVFHFNTINNSHHVHEITFGNPFPRSHNPLKDASYMVENQAGGVFMAHMNVRLIPTRYQRFLSSRDTYQVSVTQHIVQPETIMPQGAPHLPGMALLYDFTPLRVDFIETRDNIFGFISSLVSIVGGVFVTVGLVTGCLLHSAAAVAKKMD